METDVLLLDDLGAWKMTDWMNDTLFYILNSRYMAKRPTLITTNFQDADAVTLATNADREHEERVPGASGIGPRLRSRLAEMCLVIKMRGEDHRQVAGRACNEAAVRGAAAAGRRPR